MKKLTIKELHGRQKWTLLQKIDHSLGVIDQFLSKVDNKGYVAFSGGKDSTVLLHLCRILKPDMKGVFCNTGVEFPDILKFVKQTENVEIIRPVKTFKQIVAEKGFPLVSKTHSHNIHIAKYNRDGAVYQNYFLGKKESMYRVPNYAKYLIDTQYDICDICCDILKKQPSKKYQEETRLFPLTGDMGAESLSRANQWVTAGGCNKFSFDGDSLTAAKSKPLSIWTDADIYGYIKMNDLQIADIYHKGVNRTGCAGCAFGAHLEPQNKCRYKVLYDLYPKFYEYFMNVENNGVTYREAIRELFNRYSPHRHLPDEQPVHLFTGLHNF